MKFFNSSKKWRFASSSITKYILAALLSLVGVQGVLADDWYFAGDMNGWNNSSDASKFSQVDGKQNLYTLDLEVSGNLSASKFKITNKTQNWWYGLGSPNLEYYNTAFRLYRNDSNDAKCTLNQGTYRLVLDVTGANYDDPYVDLKVTGIIVTIDQPVQNADGSYTITGRFTNANPGQQNIHTCQIVFSEGVGQGVGANETATVGEDGSFSITEQLVEGQQYTCCARAIDGSIGNHDSEYITFTAEAATSEPEPTVTDLYIFGVNDNWSNPSDEWKCTSVSQDGNVYTWEWSSAPKTFNGSTYFKVGAKNAANTGIDDNNNYGPSGSDVTLDFNGVQSIVQTVVNSSASKAFKVSAATEISKIEFDKSALTVTFYTPEETQDPVYAATITADASTSQQIARQVTLTSLLTEAAAGTDLTSATCQFQYLSADAAEGTEYSNLDAPVAYNADGTSLTTTALPQGGKYLFRAVWTLNGEVVATSEPSEATCVYPVTPYSDMFAVQWEFATDPADLDVTITANIGVAEGSCLTMEQISKAPLECEIFVNEVSYRPQQTELVGDVMKATLTVAGLNASDELGYRIVLVTGAANASVVSAQGNMQIPGGTYVVEAPELHNSTVYFRGDENGWAYDGIDDKYIGKTYDDVNVFWDWIDNPIEFESVGDNAGSKFKFDDTSDGSWGNAQWNNGDSDAWIGEVQISDNKAAFTAVYGSSESGNYWLLPEICPAKISRIDLNTETNQIVITFADYNRPAKDIWFRSEIVEGGWGDGISDPIASGVNPKYQGQTKDGITYVWDWSGSNAVTLDASEYYKFKFGEYTGNAGWGNAGYGGASDSDKKLQSSSFGQTLNIVQASGNEFIPQEKITITRITLNIQDMTVVFTGEAYVDRYPVTLNIVNGETGGTVIIDPVDISSLAIGETVTVTANANEGYVPVFEASNGCQMTDGDADNIKVFEITAANPVIIVTFQVQCQTFEPGFEISGRFNAGIEDADGLYQGSPISSRETETDPADGYWSDGARFIQLTANSVPANYFEWKCTSYAIDGVKYETIPDIAWTDHDKTSARAELSLPGTYTFVCNAKCNSGDDWTRSAELTITAPAPEMGFNGNIVTNHDWGNPEWAGQVDGGYMQRRSGFLTWVSNPFTVDGFGTDNTDYHFVIDQRYKFLGCVKQDGWTENNECNDLPGDGNNKDNKINRSNLTFENVAWDGNQGANFAAINPGTWVANETRLQLTVTMTGWDSYTVALEEVSQECTTPADNFAISARLNQGSGAPFEGNLVASGSNTATGGYFADDFRTVTLTTTQVADTYEWKLVGYAIDGNAQATADLSTLATITNDDAQTATALLSVPGDYTFQCVAACTDGTPVNSATVTISTYPEIGFDGPIATPGGWNHAWAGTDGLMNRAQGSLTWSKTFIYQSQEGLSDQNCFVVIQRYKLGCIVEASQGWAGFDECGGIDGNKINKQDVEMSGVHLVDPGNLNYNFVADDVSAWTPGVTELTLTVTMTDWDSYTVELSKKQEQIFAYYSSNNETMGTVTMKVGDTPIAYGADITAYIGQQVTLTASPAQGYKVASWEINGKVTESDRTTIKPTLSGDDLNVVVTFERNCYAGVAYDLTGGGVICAKGGSTELSLNTLNNVTYQLYKDGAKYKDPVQGNGEAAKWTISETGTYTAKAYDSRHEECEEQAMDMKGRAVVTSVEAPEISVNPGANVHLTVLQARSFTADVPVDWSITEVTGSGDYCEGNGYMISSKTDTSLVAKFLCIGTAKITATMKDPNQNCKAEVTVYQNAAETEVCAPEPDPVQ